MQVQYYFSDANLQRDAFLAERIAMDPEGWVPLSLIAVCLQAPRPCLCPCLVTVDDPIARC